MSCEHNPIPKMHIGRAIASQWVHNYQSIKRPVLAATAASGGDTRSILYPIASWKGLMDEAICQGATGIRIYFAAYSENPVLPGESRLIPPGANKNMTVVFALTRTDDSGVERDIFIDEDPNFERRREITHAVNKDLLEFDTGTPCPPATCSTSLP